MGINIRKRKETKKGLETDKRQVKSGFVVDKQGKI
jgi:hypothetical protein